MFSNSIYDRAPFRLCPLLKKRPNATAYISGSPEYPQLQGTVRIYQTNAGVLVHTQVSGLPEQDAHCGGRFFGFHIHEGGECAGSAEDPFADAMSHYDPAGCEHPYHAGDLPPLIGCEGFALAVFLTDRFTVREVMGKTVIIHDSPDDFTTQPSGNSGMKIACGVIR